MIRTKPFSDADKLRLWEIEKDPVISQKMLGKIKDKKELDDWLSENIIYGICDTENNIIGFVQLYEMGESLIRRLPIANKNNLYEISFALPEKYRYTSGLVTSAVREVCSLYPNYQLLAFTHPNNEKSIRVLERSGFSLIGKTKYHANEKVENLVYLKKSMTRSCIMVEELVHLDRFKSLGVIELKTNKDGVLIVDIPSDKVDAYVDLYTQLMRPGRWNEYVGPKTGFYFKMPNGDNKHIELTKTSGQKEINSVLRQFISNWDLETDLWKWLASIDIYSDLF